jgi:hypothetical protein
MMHLFSIGEATLILPQSAAEEKHPKSKVCLTLSAAEAEAGIRSMWS